MVVLGDGCPWNNGEGLPAEAPNRREIAGPEVWLGNVNQRSEQPYFFPESSRLAESTLKLKKNLTEWQQWPIPAD